MADANRTNPFLTQLLRQDQGLTEAQYKEHRMQLEQALNRVERREKIANWVGYSTLPLAVVLAFLGGSGVVGSFDAFDSDATVLSVTLAVLYFLCLLAFAMSVTSYYTRFRPRVREIKDQMRDASLLALHSEIVELRKQVELLLPGNSPKKD